jgi:DNA-binding HxlR family transcriptional regulator
MHVLMPTKPRSQKVPIQDAVMWILHDYELNSSLSLPLVSLLAIVDILHVLDQSGGRGFHELLGRLRTLHNSSALSFYLDSLIGLNMVSRNETKYKGAIPVKTIFSITENGKIQLKLVEQALRILNK